jgi:hypothetical protein
MENHFFHWHFSDFASEISQFLKFQNLKYDMCARKYGMRARKYGPLGHQTDIIQNDSISSYEVSGLHITSPFQCTLYPFLSLIEQLWIPTEKCTILWTLNFHKWKYKVHPKVQSTSESTRYTNHACFNPISRYRLKHKKESSSNEVEGTVKCWGIRNI